MAKFVVALDVTMLGGAYAIAEALMLATEDHGPHPCLFYALILIL